MSHTTPNTEASHTMSDLPRMEDFIANSLHAIPNPTEGMCPICQLTFTEDPEAVVQTPCSHHFHRGCLIFWLGSTSDERISCPTCRTVYCRPNLLTAEQITSRQTRADALLAETIGLDHQLFLLLMNRVDVEFTQQHQSNGPYNFIGILRSVRNWHMDENNGVTPLIPGHGHIGLVWLDSMTATRLRDLIEDAGIPTANNRAVRVLQDFLAFIQVYLRDLAGRSETTIELHF